MTKLSLFEELVASEAAVRADYIHRNKRFRFSDAGLPVDYDATNPDSGNSRAEVTAHLYENFIRTYNYMFKDSYQHEQLVEGRIFNTRDLTDDDRQQLMNAFQDFVGNNYDESGQPILDAKAAVKELASLYTRINSHVPLRHAGMALGSLFVELGRGDKWKEVTPNGVDFTRGEPKENLLQTIEDAIFGQNHNPETSNFIPFPERIIDIGGVKFPYQMVAGPHMEHTHLITSTGHLVDMTDDLKAAIEKHIRAGKPLDEFLVDIDASNNHLWQFQQPASEGSEKAKRNRRLVREKLDDMSVAHKVDALTVRQDGSSKMRVPLVSMEVDMMTGLAIRNPGGGDSELKTFKSFLAKQGYAELSDLLPADFTQNITALSDEVAKEQARGKLRRHVADTIERLSAKAAGNSALQGLIVRAGKRLEETLPHVYEVTDKAFIKEETGELKQAPKDEQKPKMYLTMGGTASGKGGLKTLAKKECGDDLVVASLDDARSDTDRYWLYLATNNHNDDYKTVEEFAKAHRDLTTRRALAGHYDLFIDGSGVPYENRNDKTTRQFKENGYDVSVLAAQAPLYINDPQKRKELSAAGKKFNDSAGRLGDRLVEGLRIVPIEIAAEKHIGFALATRNAARDTNVDRFMVEDVSGPVGSAYTLSYVMTVGPDDMRQVAALQGKELKDAITSRHLVPDWVKLPKGEDRDQYYDAKVIRDNQDGTYRVEIITDLRQYVNMVQKGLLRRNSTGPEAWFDNTVRSDIEGHFKGEGGKLRLQSPQGVADTPWTNYQPLSSLHTPATPSASWSVA